MSKPINISASRGAAILGLSSYRTPLQIWLEIMEARKPGFCQKHNYELPVFEETPAICWGKAFESAIVKLAEDKNGCEILGRERLCCTDGKTKSSESYIESNNHFITCHIDGEYSDEFLLNYILHEGKTTSYFYYKDNFGESETDQVPIDYQIQCQHQMICTGAEKVILSVLVFPRRVEEWEEMGIIPMRNNAGIWELDNQGIALYSSLRWADQLNQMGYFHQYIIKAHPELQQLMIKHYTEWWNTHIIGEKEPEPQSYDDIKALVRAPVGTIIVNDKAVRLMSEYKNIKKEISGSGSLAKRCEQIKVELLKYARAQDKTIDDDSTDKWIFRNQQGEKIASYGKNKNGSYVFR